MKLSARPLLLSVLPALLAVSLGQTAHAISITQSGTFKADNDLATYTFNVPTAETVNIYTTSYGGGMNLDGSTSLSGGFVTNLSLFTSAGKIVAGTGGTGMCGAGQNADPTTTRCEDAYLSQMLSAGSYELVLSEFPNVAINNLSDGFLFSSDPHATGDQCSGGKGKRFLDTTAAPCVQRNSGYSYNISSTSPVPEPPTWALVLPGAGLLMVAGRRYMA